LVYATAAVESLKIRIEAASMPNRAIPNSYAPPALHTR
jgi:hypothetical protein